MNASQFYITYDVVRHGWQVQRWVNGRYVLDVGPVWKDGKAARQYVDTLDAMPEVSPLRDPVEVLTDAHVGASTGLLRGESAGTGGSRR